MVISVITWCLSQINIGLCDGVVGNSDGSCSNCGIGGSGMGGVFGAMAGLPRKVVTEESVCRLICHLQTRRNQRVSILPGCHRR